MIQMFTCKQVSNALAKEDYAKMSLFRRLALRFHIALCVVCGKYNRQVMIMQDASRCYRNHEEHILEKQSSCCLSKGDKDAMKALLRKQS